MAVLLAEADGQLWVVLGDEHLGALLVNELPPEIPVELVRCATRADAFAMWHDRSPDAWEGGHPWLINPIIADRILRSFGQVARMLSFSQWSAMPDAGAEAELADAASWLAANPGGRLVLRQFAPDEPVPGQADLQRLRAQLVRAALGRKGADAARMADETARAATDADVERLEIVTVLP